MQRSLRIGSTGLGSHMLEKARIAALRILTTTPLPWLPPGLVFPTLEIDVGANGHSHNCEEESVLVLPAVLAFDVRIVDANTGLTYSCYERVNPYWIGPVTLIHAGIPAPDGHRPLTPWELASALAQYPEVGSLQSLNGGWYQRRCHVYRRNGYIVADCGSSVGEGHHNAYAPAVQLAPFSKVVRD